MPQTDVPQLLGQGLIMTGLGMGLVFVGLGALWGLIALLMRVFPERPAIVEAVAGDGSSLSPVAESLAAAEPAAALDAERARVAAIAAALLQAGLVMGRSPRPAIDEAQPGTASWAAVHRGRGLSTWQPPRPSYLDSERR